MQPQGLAAGTNMVVAAGDGNQAGGVQVKTSCGCVEQCRLVTGAEVLSSAENLQELDCWCSFLQP